MRRGTSRDVGLSPQRAQLTVTVTQETSRLPPIKTRAVMTSVIMLCDSGLTPMKARDVKSRQSEIPQKQSLASIVVRNPPYSEVGIAGTQIKHAAANTFPGSRHLFVTPREMAHLFGTTARDGSRSVD